MTLHSGSNVPLHQKNGILRHNKTVGERRRRRNNVTSFPRRRRRDCCVTFTTITTNNQKREREKSCFFSTPTFSLSLSRSPPYRFHALLRTSKDYLSTNSIPPLLIRQGVMQLAFATEYNNPEKHILLRQLVMFFFLDL
jgi:hypothetical protein